MRAYSQLEHAVTRNQTQVLTVASPALYHKSLQLDTEAIYGAEWVLLVTYSQRL